MLSSLKRAGALVVAMRTEQGKGESFTSNMKLFLFAGLCFALSYVGAFLSKWLLASIATGENEFILAASSAGVRFGAEDSAGIATLLIIGAAVFFRYALLQNHSYLHEFFTYRALATTVFSVLSAVVLSSCGADKKLK